MCVSPLSNPWMTPHMPENGSDRRVTCGGGGSVGLPAVDGASRVPETAVRARSSAAAPAATAAPPVLADVASFRFAQPFERSLPEGVAEPLDVGIGTDETYRGEVKQRGRAARGRPPSSARRRGDAAPRACVRGGGGVGAERGAQRAAVTSKGRVRFLARFGVERRSRPRRARRRSRPARGAPRDRAPTRAPARRIAAAAPGYGPARDRRASADTASLSDSKIA